ncbi:MAG: ABC transporter permease [Oscillospiraceae bacterium]|nr:ABC transporter permease [Oscillospiraceae bacterium]
MKRTPNRMNTDAMREIKNTMSRFLSLFLLSALAVAFLSGLRTTAPDMQYTADDYFDRTGLMDVRVLSTLGLTDDDIEALANAPGVERAEGGWYVDATLHTGDASDLIVRFHSLSEQGINLPELVEGRLPENDRECVVEPDLLTAAGISLGDTIHLDTAGTDYEDSLFGSDYTVVGTVTTSLYMSRDRGTSTIGTGRLTAVAFLPRGAFDMDIYTEAYLLADGARELMCYGEDYEDLMDSLLDELEPLGDQRAAHRYDEVVGEATDTLNDAQKEYDDAEAEANEKLTDAEEELSDARKKLDDGWKEYEDGKATLARETAQAERDIADGEKELADALTELQDGEADYEEGLADYQQGKADYEQGLLDYQEGQDKYNDGLKELQDGEAEYEENRKKLEDAQADYDQGVLDYEDGLKEYEDGKKKLEDAKKQLDDAQAELRAGRRQLSQGLAQYEEGLEQYEAGVAVYNEKLALYEAGMTQLAGLMRAREGLGMFSAGNVGTTLAGVAAESANQDAGHPYTTGAMQGVATLTYTLTGVMGQLTPGTPEYAQVAALVDQLGKLPTDPTDATSVAAFQAAAGNPDSGMGALLAGGYGTLDATCNQTEAQLRDAKVQLDAGKAQLDASKVQLDAAAARLDDAASQLADGERQYNEGKQEYEDGVAELEEAEQKLADAKTELEDGKAELEDGWAQLADGRKELDDGWAELRDAEAELLDAEQKLKDAAQELADGEAELTDARQKLDDGWAEYQDGLAELEDAKRKLPRETAKAQKELDDALIELQDGEKEYADGVQEYEDAKAEAEEKLSDARRELNDARREIAEIEECKWYILGRNTNAGYVSYDQDAQRMGNLAQVFPLIFFLVAALVCLTTMTRMVEEQRVQIGGLKALGYSRGAIAKKYVGYGFLASFGGGIVGLLVGCTLIPTIIFNAWKVMYTVGDLEITLFPGIYALAVGAAVFCVAGTALWSSYAALTAVPATLMRPKAPPAGKRVLLEHVDFIWKRLSFTWKVTVRNLFRYKKRFWMAVIGIGGCTALLITGFGLRDSIHGFFDKQYDEITTYHGTVSLADKATQDEILEIGRELDRQELVESWVTISDEMVTAESSRRSVDSNVYLSVAVDEEKFSEFIHLRDWETGESMSLSDEGAVITAKLSELLGVTVGEEITVVDSDNVRTEVPVVGITENYIFHYIYMTDQGYHDLFGEEPGVNSIMVRYTEDTVENSDRVASALLPLSGVSSVSRTDSLRQSVLRGLEGVDYAVIVVVVAAAALAFVVLYNLTNINITERLRELATLKVLGFNDHEMSQYVYRENIFLTIFGILLGLVMGKFLHQWLVMTVEIDMAMFYRKAEPLSYVLSALLTVVFSLLVNLAAKRRLRKIDMVESLKTVE